MNFYSVDVKVQIFGDLRFTLVCIILMIFALRHISELFFTIFSSVCYCAEVLLLILQLLLSLCRGIAHVGIIRCMVEAGIPIDIVGGTSIGSFMGALWADETDIVRVTQRAREWAMVS